jgi:uncharacterized protein
MKSTLHPRLSTAGIRTVTCAAIALSFVLPAAAAEPDVPPAKGDSQPTTIAQQVELAAAYLTGHGVQKDEKRAAYWYERAAEAGDPVAQKEIGYFYQIGLGVAADPARAAHWYQLSAAGGLVSSKVNLGVAYAWGAGVPRNPELAMQLFREAANKGSGVGACYLGDMYAIGIEGKQDLGAAQRWFETGAKLHEPRAEFDLGSLISSPGFRQPNLPRAAELFRRSAEGGYVPAMHALGLLLVNNPQLAKSPSEAIGMLQEAAQAGTWKSSVVLGLLSRDGKSVPLDRKNAYYHFRVAVLQGGDRVAQLLKNDILIVTTSLGPESTATIDKQAADWYQQHHLKLQFIYKGGENWSRYPAFALADPEDGAFAGQLIPTSPFE